MDDPTTAEGFKSSWWVHLPGILAVAAMIAVMAINRPWPPRTPAHFDLNWNVDRWSSPWTSAAFPILATIILFAGMLGSAIWSRHEEGRKRFNVTLLLIAAPLGAITGVHMWYWQNLPQLAATGRAPHPWGWVWTCAITLAATTVILETFRKPRKIHADA